MSPLRFLILTQYYPPEIGAPSVRLSAFARELVRAGHSVRVVTALPNHPTGVIFPEYRGRMRASEVIDGVEVRRVWLYPALGAGLKRMLNYGSFAATSTLPTVMTKDVDVIFIESPPLTAAVPGLLAARARGIPAVLNIADLWPDSIVEMGLAKPGVMMRTAARLESWAYRKATIVNAVTEGIRDTLVGKKGVPTEKVLFLPNGVDVRAFSPRPPSEELAAALGLTGKPVFVYAGTLGLAQGLETVLHAIRLAHEDGTPVWAVFLGDGSDRARLESLAKDLDIMKYTRFIDPRPPTFVAELMSIATAGLVVLKDVPLFAGARPSKMFPIMACSRPVLYSGAGEGADIVEHARAGVVVPPEQPRALAKAMIALAGDNAACADYGRAGREYVSKRLTWESITRQWLSDLESKLQSRTSTTPDGA